MQTFPLHVDKSPKTSAKIAQLVEHDLAKVGVAGSSPVFRSKLCIYYADKSPGGGIGRHATLRGSGRKAV